MPTSYLMGNAQQVCAHVCGQPGIYLCEYIAAGVCVPAQLKENSLRLSESTLKSGSW